jgi:hypothetical protein
MIPFLSNQKLWIGVGCVVAAGVVLGLITMYGNARYREGFENAEKAAIQALSAAQAEAADARQELAALQAQRQNQSELREETRIVVVRETVENIVNAETSQARFDAYVAGRNSVRQPADEYLARARADYLSSLTP